MSTRSSARNLFPPLDNPELTIQRRSRTDPTLLNDFEMAAEGTGDIPVPDLRTMEELCQPSLNGRVHEDEYRFIRGSRTLPSNMIINPKEDLKGITTRSETPYQGPTIPTTSSSLPPVVERETEATKDTIHPTNNGSTKDVQPPVVQIEPSILNSEPVVAPIIELVLAPTLLSNKDKLSKLARTLLNEHCSAVLLKKLPEKLGDPGKFLIPCDFSGMAECLALADLSASINLMPLSVWNKLSLTDLSPTCMTLELTDRSILVRLESPKMSSSTSLITYIPGSSRLQRFFRCAMFIYSFFLCYSLSLYPFTERYAQPYFFSCLIRKCIFTTEGMRFIISMVSISLEGLLPSILLVVVIIVAVVIVAVILVVVVIDAIVGVVIVVTSGLLLFS
nr:reverse transcriptase domain-containing protein [Tanacetum cinerariifolium]